MATQLRRPVDRWAMRSRPKAFLLLIGLGLAVSTGLASVTAAARIGVPKVLPSGY